MLLLAIDPALIEAAAGLSEDEIPMISDNP